MPNDRLQGRFRGKFRITGAERLVAEQVPNYVPKHGFEEIPEGLGAGFDDRVGSEAGIPGRFRGRFRHASAWKFRG